MNEAIAYVNSHEKPLALYLFTRDQSVIKAVLEQTSSGSVLVNDCLMQGIVKTLPFGGVGESGMGGYHGKHTFELFSHKKAVMIKQQNLEFVNSFRYPPYSETKLKVIEAVMGHEPSTPRKTLKRLVLKGAAIAGVAGVACLHPTVAENVSDAWDFFIRAGL